MTEPEGHGSLLDMPQQFEDVGSYQVRDKLQELVELDLLGPWDGARNSSSHGRWARASGTWWACSAQA